MIKNFFSARLLVAALCAIVGIKLGAQVADSNASLPSYLTDCGNTLLWLDASDSSTYDVNGNGKVTEWRSKADSSVVVFPTADSRADSLNNTGFKNNFANYIDKTDIGDAGSIGITNNVSAFLMGSIASGVDMSFNRLTTIRTVFWVMDIMQNGNAFFLGDNNDYDFHRNSLNYNNGQGAIGSAETSIWCDGELVENKTSTPVPAGLHVYSMVAQQNFRACHLSLDRNTKDGNEQNGSRHGGKALSELIIFDVSLSDTMVRQVESYLQAKWMGEIDLDPSFSTDKTQISISEVNKTAEAERPQILDLTSSEAVSIVVDQLPKAKTLAILQNGEVTFTINDDVSPKEFFSKVELGIEGVKLPISEVSGTPTVKANGMIELGENEVITFEVADGESSRIGSVVGGKIVKTGEGTLRIGRASSETPNVEETTIEIMAGKVFFHEGDGAVFLKNPTFVLHEGAQLDNYGWPQIVGTLTLESDVADTTIFTNNGGNTAEFEGNPTIVKKGAGKITLKCGAANGAAHNNVISLVKAEEGTLAFSGKAAKVIANVSGEGTLEQAGGGAMTITGEVSPEASLKVSAGTLNNFCAARKGSLTLGGLEIAKDATYRMTSVIDHLVITKSLYLEGEAHKYWYVTLENGAVIATNPENPMALAGLEFGNSVVLGKDQAIGSTLAKVIKPKSMPKSVSNVEENLKAIPFALEYRIDSLIVSRPFKVELETVPGQNLDAAKYIIHLKNLSTVPEEGNLRVRITTPWATAIANVKQHGSEWYAELSPAVMNDAKGGAYKIKIELGVNNNNTFQPIEEYSDISINVRPGVIKNDKWIDEARYDRWRTGTWDTEGEYITISEGYVQVEGEKVSFVPSNVNNEAATKLHFAVKFGKAMKLEILNALKEDGQIAGVALMEDDAGEIGYAALNPSTNEYVQVTSSDKKPIDIAAEHLVEVTLSNNGVAYSIDGVALVTKDDRATSVFSLPKNASIQIAEIDFVGEGAVKSMTAEEYSTKLAVYKEVEYDTIEDALAAAKDATDITITPLWNASWVPSTNLVDKVITFAPGYKVTPDTISSNLAEHNMVLRPNADGSYSVISKFLSVTIPYPEKVNNGFGVFLESVTANSMHLGWVYDYASEATKNIAKATVVYDDDVTINFSTTLENKGLLVDRNNTSNTLERVTFIKVRDNIELVDKDIPILDKEPIEGQRTLAKFGVMKQQVAKAESVGILDFTTAAEGVTFTVGLLDAEGNDITKIVSEQIGEMVYFAEKLGDEWKPVGAENVEIITNDDGVQVMFAKQKDTTSGFYKVVIPDNAK